MNEQEKWVKGLADRATAEQREAERLYEAGEITLRECLERVFRALNAAVEQFNLNEEIEDN